MSFRLKIALSMICLVALLFGCGGALLVSYVFDESFKSERTATYDSYRWVMGTVSIANGIDPHAGIAGVEDAVRQLSTQQADAWSSLALYANDEELFTSGEPIEASTTTINPGECALSYEKTNEGAHLIVASGMINTSASPLRLDVARDVSYLFDERDRLISAFQLVFAIALVLCAVISFVLSSILTRPLRRLSSASRAIAKGDFKQRVDMTAHDEIGRVAADFNTMAASLERGVRAMSEAMDSQERFIGSFAHEVKTPITSIIGYAELASSDMLDDEELRDAYGFIASEGKRLERLSRKLLQLQLLQKEGVRLVPCSPTAIAEATVEATRPLFTRDGIDVQFSGEEGTCLLEPDLVRTLLTNLLENARRAFDEHEDKTRGHKQRSISVAVAMINGGCELSVEDNGRGIPADSLDRLTDAFYRVDKSRSRKAGGAGLGLSLCLEIAHAHHGDISIESAPGQGTLITVQLLRGVA